MRMLTIHDVSQFAYCPRAGVIAYEGPFEDTGDEGWFRKLGYLPKYQLAQLERFVFHATLALMSIIAVMVICLFVLAVGGQSSGSVARPLFVLMLVAASVDFVLILRVLARLKAARGTPAREPTFQAGDIEEVHWWELRAAGFQPRSCKPLVDDAILMLTGNPWCVLIRGDQWIPVLRIGGSSKTIYRNRRLRIAGYCHLIETTTNYRSPYGIVLMPSGLNTKAIRNTDSLQLEFATEVEKFNALLDDGGRVPPPQNENRCEACQFGQPYVFIADKSETIANGQPLPPHTVKFGGKYWHSQCGDRYRWHPPAVKKFARLRPTS